MKQGIVLLCFGKSIYGRFAFNLALSLKHHSPNTHIHLVYEDKSISSLQDYHRQYFDSFQEIDQNDIYDITDIAGHKYHYFNPAKTKASLYKYLPFEYNIYLDVDAIALNQIEPLFEHCINKGGYYYIQHFGKYTKARESFPEMIWADPKHIWARYQLKDSATLPATNSSFVFIKKCPEAENLFKQIHENVTVNPCSTMELRHKWGGTYPDELAVNVALAQLDIDADPGITPIFFTQSPIKDYNKVNEFYFIGLYGGERFTHKSLIDYYDRIVNNLSREKIGRNQEFKAHILTRDKHPNKR